jgi:hypothetical protein
MRRRRAVQSLTTFALALLGFYLSTLGAIEFGPPRWVDPEYGKRLQELKARQREHPNSPWILGLGSSRMAMGLHPGSLPLSKHEPKLFNFAMVGSGPIMQRLAWHRLRADGVKPAAVLVEYWPPFLHQHGDYHEAARFDPHRVRSCDSRVISEHFPDPNHFARSAWKPWAIQRRNWLNQLAPRWLPNHERRESLYAKIDRWGRLPGRDSLRADEVHATHNVHASYYQPLFADYEVSRVADEALQTLLTEIRSEGVEVAVIYLPESRTFPEWMPQAAKLAAAAHEKTIRDKTHFVDARRWIEDAQIPDRIHLMTPGATQFTRQVDRELPRLFPNLYREFAAR